MKHQVLILLLTSCSAAGCGGSSQGSGVANGGAAGALGGASASGGSGSGAAAAAGAGGTSGFETGFGGAGATSAGASGSGPLAPPTLGCAGWKVQTAREDPATAGIVGGALQLDLPAGAIRSDGPYGADVSVAQAGLSGDFNVTISWQDFVPGDATPFVGPRFAAAAWWHDPITSSVYQASGYVGAATADATISHRQQFTINQLRPSPTPASLVGASGSFRIQRTGTAMTVTTTVNGQVVIAQSTEPFSEQPLDLVMWMDDTSHSGTPSAKEAAVTVTQVQLSGGGGSVKSDDFSCP